MVAVIPIITAVGEFAAPHLIREATKIGGKKFIQKFGLDAWISITTAVTGGTIAQETPPVDLQNEKLFGTSISSLPGMPTTYYDDTTHKSVTETGEGLVIGGEKKEPIPPPEPFTTPVDTPQDTTLKTPIPKKIDTTLSTPIPEKEDTTLSTPIPKESGPIVYTKDDVSKQTKKLVPEKPEFGKLTKTEKQTALALKGDKPDYYSRIIKAIKETKQTKMPYDQWAAIAKKAGSKEELDYLDIKGKDTVSKEDLLYEIGSKDIASNIMVTTIPENDMVSDFEEFSLGYENPGSKKMNVYQIDLPPETSADVEFNLGKKLFQASPSHVKEKYGRNQFLHTRTQVGLGDPDAPPADFGDEAKQLAEKLQNTLIIDEIQSDWIQSIQKYGTKDNPKFKVLKGSEITPEFIKENYGDFYDLRIEKYQTQKDLLEKTGLSTNKVLYATDTTTGIRSVDTRIQEDMYYVFGDKGLTQESRSVPFQEKEMAMDHATSRSVADFPIKHSKKWVEFALNNEIKNAVLGGQDSIAITNGNIQQSRSKEEGTKKFYDEIVLGQLKKIATKYGAKLENISFEPDKYLRLEENLKNLKEKGFEETTVTREELVKYITNKWDKDDPNRPAHAVRRFRGRHTPSDWVVNLPDFREIILGDEVTPFRDEHFDEMVKLLPQKTELLLFKNRETGEINFEYPVIEKSQLGGTDEFGRVEKTYLNFLAGYQYNADTRGHGVIKMELPKKLQKEILKEPIKFSKAKPQIELPQETERLFA